MNDLNIKNRQAEATAREILSDICTIFENNLEESSCEDIYSQIVDTIKTDYLYESDYT